MQLIYSQEKRCGPYIITICYGTDTDECLFPEIRRIGIVFFAKQIAEEKVTILHVV